VGQRGEVRRPEARVINTRHEIPERSANYRLVNNGLGQPRSSGAAPVVDLFLPRYVTAAVAHVLCGRVK
jgi:hypothetical protein